MNFINFQQNSTKETISTKNIPKNLNVSHINPKKSQMLQVWYTHDVI